MDSEDLDKLWDFDNPELSEQRFRGVGTEEAMTQVARALGLQGRFDEAHAVLDSLTRVGIVLPRISLERGRLFRSAGDPGRALPEFQAALQESQRQGVDFYAVDAAHMIAICKDDVGAHEQAILLAANSSDERSRGWRASLLNNLGWANFDQGNLEKALEAFQEALSARESNDNEKQISIAKWCVARCLRQMGRTKQAIEVQYKLLGTDEAGFVFEEIGECLLTLGKPLAAQPYFAEAAVMLKGIEPARLERIQTIGKDSRFAQIEGASVKLSRPVKQIGDLLSTTKGLAMWLGEVRGNFQLGSQFDLLIDGDENDTVPCTLEELDEHAIKLQWQNNSELCATYSDGVITLIHSGIENIAMYAAAWHGSIDLIKHLAEGNDRSKFPENYEELLPEYQRLISLGWYREIL